MKVDRLISLAVFAAVFALVPVLKADESAALAVLASADSDLHAKAMACDELGRVGTAKAVPELAKLLSDERLNDYARDGLERIPHASAGKALVEALKTSKGSLRVGVVTSLGDRRELAAVPALAKIAQEEGKDDAAVSAALTSLGQIANDEAGKAIMGVLERGSAAAKISAARAALIAAEQMEKGGRKEEAGKLRSAAAAEGVPVPKKFPGVGG